MHDDGPQAILPPPVTPEKVAERLRGAKSILAEAGFPGAGVAEAQETLLIQVAFADLTRLQDEAFREGLVGRLKSLGYAFVAVDLPQDGDGMAGSGASA
jgi:hypothetical protein